MRMKILASLFCLLILVSDRSFCQENIENELGWHEEGSRIEKAVDTFVLTHKYRLGIFRYQPRLSIRGGFDSNSVFGNVENEREKDFFVSVIPGIGGGLKFGSRAYFRILQDFDFLYYFRNEKRRDIFGTTYAEFVTGTSRALVTLDGFYSRREQLVNEEVDEPIEHKLSHGEAKVVYSVARKTEIYHRLRVQDIIFVETEDTLNSDLTLSDRRVTTFGTGIAYALTRTLRLTGEGHVNRSEALNTNRFTNSWGALGGVEIRRDRLKSRVLVGFGESNPDEGRSRNNFLLDGRLDVLLRKHFTVGVYGKRRHEFSFLSDTAVRVVTEGGVQFISSLEKRFALSGRYTVGKNDYGDTPVAGVVVNHDTFQRAEVGVHVHMFKGFALRPGIAYLKRDSDIPGVSKSDFFYFVGLSFGYTFDF